MILGVGTDLVRVARMERGLARFGDRLAARLLAAGELEAFGRAPVPARFLAKRFAAKEALVKALGTGFSGGIGPRDIAVRHDARGRPWLHLEGAARRCLPDSACRIHLSITDEAEYAVAFVVVERTTGG